MGLSPSPPAGAGTGRWPAFGITLEPMARDASPRTCHYILVDSTGGPCYLIRMQVGMRHFGEETVGWLRSAAAAGAGRRSLAAGLCEREDWTNAAGAPCIASARLALPKIAERYGITLPQAGSPVAPGRPLPEHPDVHFSGTLAELGGVGLEMAETAEQRRALRAMMESHHPRGDPSNPGALLFYWISSERLGRVGGLCFHAANWHQRARDLSLPHT